MPLRQQAVQPPVSIAITHWAIAGGVVGLPVHVVFQDFPEPIVGEVIRRFTDLVGRETVLLVHEPRHLRLLEAAPEKIRLVLLFDAALFARCTWLLEMNRRTDSNELPPSPALITLQSRRLRDQGPGPTLVLHGYSPEVRSLTHWLETDEVCVGLPQVTTRRRVAFDEVSALMSPTTDGRLAPPLSFRERQILKGLMAGAALIRSENPDAPPDRLQVTLADYHAVHGPLQKASVQPVDEAFDPLAVAMVQRANALLEMREREGTHKIAQTGPGNGTDESNSSLVTRREILDLGNTRGETVRKLVSFLQSQGEWGHKVFCSLGTMRPLRSGTDWPPGDARALASLLLPWTEKQVRTHFHRLYDQEKLITATPPSGRIPWVYRLPESLGNPNSSFGKLPAPAELERRIRENRVGGGEGREPVVCPEPGQTNAMIT